MNRVYLFPNTRDSIPEAISGIQNCTEIEKQRFFGQVFSSLGVACETDETGLAVNEDDTNLKCTYVSNTLTISPGYAVTSGFHWLNVTAVATFDINVDFSDGDTIYIRHSGILSRLKEQAKGFFYDTASSGWVNTRSSDSWALTTTDPGVSGVVLCRISGGAVTDLRANNLLKFNNKLADDTKIAKKDRTAEFEKFIVLTSGLKFSDTYTDYKFTINPMTGMVDDVDYTAMQLLTSISGQHEHGDNNDNLTNLNSLVDPNNAWPRVDAFINSGYTTSGGESFLHDSSAAVDKIKSIAATGSWAALDAFINSGYTTSGGESFLHANNLRTVASSPLYSFLKFGVISFGDGYSRKVLTKKISSIPNYPSGITFSLVETAPSTTTSQLQDALVAYKVSERGLIFNTKAYSAITDFNSELLSLAAVNGYTTSSGLQTNSYLMSGATNLVTKNYVDSLSSMYLSSAEVDKTIEEVSAQILLLASSKSSEITDNNSTLDLLGKEILDKGARSASTLNDPFAITYQLKLSWNTPEIINNEDILRYDIRLFQYNNSATPNPEHSPSQLLQDGSDNILSDRTYTVGSYSLTQDEMGNLVTVAMPSNYQNSDEPMAWQLGYRIGVTDNSYNTVNPAKGDTVFIDGDGGHIIVDHGNDSGISTHYIQIPDTLTHPDPDIDCSVLRDVVNTDIPTSYTFPVSPDQSWIAYVRSINENNVSSAWSPMEYTKVNDLVSPSTGLPIGSGISFYNNYVSEVSRVQQDQLLRKVEEKILNLQRQIEVMPNSVTIANLIQSVNNNIA